ncbi:MAG TPA: tRNA (adenosine(37)-N6)-threonylcarbamoyltransferase complex ATPase subunit type 1 TsaE [Desulfotomaculum sp.]|nr:MAG: ATPase or kinase [Peptococcaceae bacterium BRH_c8a]KJS77652.1 MAG: ATPase or kinase [Desulfotomaculum sp. BICA1-6]HBX22597.1 tRNA (adenosine(37)-N6)-threonylcarbamoyltransferase complex ATPase subunit type 1 TsaE [Desulfotomaculum sp.]
MYSIASRSADETYNLGETLGALLQPGDLITLNGDLGAGKTCLASGVGRGLLIEGRVKSPTFALINEYEGKIPLYHMDVYRLDNPSEINDLGFEEYFYGNGAVLVEWAQKIIDFLPQQRLEIVIDKDPHQEDTRNIRLVPHGNRYEQLAGELIAHVRTGN